MNVSVFGWNAFVKAALLNREGRRTGWNVDRPIREIPGCRHEYGTEVGIPDEDAPEDTTMLAPADTVPGHAEPTPMYHYFTIGDSANVPGLIHEGGCELRLDPDVGGKVQIALLANGDGFGECKDTTSVWVRPGVPSRWWLSWKMDGRKCDVSISRLTGTLPTRPASGLTILASGARRIELIDPHGRRMLRDARTDERISEIPGASIEGLASEHDAGGDLDDRLSGYDLDIPMAAEGHYTVLVDADDGLSMSVSAYGDSGVFASVAAIDTTASPTSTGYDVLYSFSARAVTIRRLEPRMR